MKKIIALKGKGNVGKSTTIRDELYPLMLENGFEKIQSIGEPNTDIYAILEKDNIRYGITSSGDTYDHVINNLTDLNNEGCQIMVCACRTRGGTHTALKSFDIPISFVNKQVGDSNNSTQLKMLNRQDAELIYNKI